MGGYTILSPKPLLGENILSIILIGTNPRTGIAHLINFNILLNFLISPENSLTSGPGKTFDQNPSFPLPNETCSFASCGSWQYRLKKSRA
jgi:hypothetical protein